MWSFTTAQKSKALNYADFDLANAAIFSKNNGLKYYTPEMHYAAYALPPFVRNMIKAHITKAETVES